MKGMIEVVFVSLLLFCVSCQEKQRRQMQSKCQNRTPARQRFNNCVRRDIHVVIADNFNGAIKAGNMTETCILFVKKNCTESTSKRWPQMTTSGDGQPELLYISKWFIREEKHLFVVSGKCNVSDFTRHCADGGHMPSVTGCQAKCFQAKTICGNGIYDENSCPSRGNQVNSKFKIVVPDATCVNCNNPIQKPSETLDEEFIKDLNVTVDIEGGELEPAQAAGLMDKMSDIASLMNGSSAAISMGKNITGVLVRETNPEDVTEVSFAYKSSSDGINIIDGESTAATFSRSVTVPKEAFDKAVSLNVSIPYAALFRFLNMATDELNSTLLGDEVMAVEMGSNIANLTDKISINFRKMKYEGFPSCRSWNGEGARPNWTDDGCETITKGDNITCQCSHLTFFAILMAPPNETISSSDLKSLTIITQVGCGMSMLFLSIVLFMHFLLRRTKATKATRILIHLVTAMFMLNLSFLVNNGVANLKNSVGCKIMAAAMHYFMLSTFTWFAVQAIHLCLQLHMMGKITIRRYMLKVSIPSWLLPSVVVIVLLILEKYGEQIIYTSDTDETVSMCWINDSNVHYIVNIGYYSLVFLVTFTTFIIVVSWLLCLKRIEAPKAQNERSGKRIFTILGLCCMLGISWGFAFFAYGVLQIPAYYIFTILNSFQGFFLFIYYYNTSHSGEVKAEGVDDSSHSSTATSVTSLDKFENPYMNKSVKK